MQWEVAQQLKKLKRDFAKINYKIAAANIKEEEEAIKVSTSLSVKLPKKEKDPHLVVKISK
jgi:hypothetical protein